jgi:hypothetical protein
VNSYLRSEMMQAAVALVEIISSLLLLAAVANDPTRRRCHLAPISAAGHPLVHSATVGACVSSLNYFEKNELTARATSRGAPLSGPK